MKQTEWDPDQYARFSGARMRPAAELIARIPDLPMRTIIDLGCGEGSVTALLMARWPTALIVGVDSSSAMLAKARAILPSATFIEADIATWNPTAPVDLIFSNAALHWLGDHTTLMPALMRHLLPNGVLAVQMPANFEAPSHRRLAELAGSSKWREHLGRLVRQSPVAPIHHYIDWLSLIAASIDAWETTDFLMLDGENAVLEWMSGTALRPFLASLAMGDGAAFRQELALLLAEDYPRRSDGRTLFPFTRRYFVARQQLETDRSVR